MFFLKQSHQDSVINQMMTRVNVLLPLRFTEHSMVVLSWLLMIFMRMSVPISSEQVALKEVTNHSSYGAIWESLEDNYQILRVTPTRITNDEIVSVYFRSTKPNVLDFITAVSPADAPINEVAPVMYGNCASDPRYLSSGVGRLDFQFTNLRQSIAFYYNIGGYNNSEFSSAGTREAKVVPKRSREVVRFIDDNEPLRNRIIPNEDDYSFRLLWDSANSVSPTMKYGPKSGVYTHTSVASTDHVRRGTLCGSPANDSGWYDLGSIHTAHFTTQMIKDGGWFQPVYYVYGDAESGVWSKEYVFTPPPPRGSNGHPSRPTRVALLADMGIGWPQSSHTFGNVEPHGIGGATFSWGDSGYASFNTSISMQKFVNDGQLDAVFINGDLSYANGFLAAWNMYTDMINRFVGSIAFMNTLGNHEADTTIDIPGSLLFKGPNSGGECSVVSNTLFPFPNEKAGFNKEDRSKDIMWWSKDIGLIHFVGMSTEHDFCPGSPQFHWIEKDLRNVDRTITPWIVFATHRSPYVNSNNCCKNAKPGIPIPGPNDNITEACPEGCRFGSDRQVMLMLQRCLEDLLYKYRVNLVFSGHLHLIQRQSAIYNNEVIQAAEMVLNDDVNLEETDSIVNDYTGIVALHENPQATVYTLIGTAGQGFQNRLADPTPEWNELSLEEFGYAVVTAVNRTCLVWELINNIDNSILDKMVITQPSRFPPSFGMSQEKFEAEWIGGSPTSNVFSGGAYLYAAFVFLSVLIVGYGWNRRRNRKTSIEQYNVIYDEEMDNLPISLAKGYQSVG